MRRLLPALVLFGLLAFAAFGTAAAANSSFDFESFSAGNVNGQSGWSMTGSYDVAVANVGDFSNASGFDFGSKALRISNYTASGAFDDQTKAAPLAEASGESGDDRFDASFDIGSTSGTVQSGLSVGVAPDDGHGGRDGATSASMTRRKVFTSTSSMSRTRPPNGQQARLSNRNLQRSRHCDVGSLLRQSHRAVHLLRARTGQ